MKRLSPRATRRNATLHSFAIESLEERTVLSVTPLGDEFRVDIGYKAGSSSLSPKVWLSETHDLTTMWWSGDELVFQSFDADGSSVTDPFRIHPAEEVAIIDADRDLDGNTYVVWMENNNRSVYFSRYDAHGEQLAETKVVATNQVNSFVVTSIDVNSHGDVAISWNSNQGVIARIYSAGGWESELIYVAPPKLTFQFSDVGIDDVGNVVVLWYDPSGYKAARFNSMGERLGGEVLDVSGSFLWGGHAGENVELPVLAINGDGTFVVTWSASDAPDDEPGDQDVYARIFDGNGEALSDVFRVSETSVGQQHHGYVSINASDVVFSWSVNDKDGVTPGVFARHFDLSGNALSSDIVVASGMEEAHRISGTAMNADGEFAVLWQQSRGGYSPQRVSMRLYVDDMATGPAIRVDPIPSNLRFTSNFPPVRATVSAAGDVIVAWTDATGVRAQIRYSENLSRSLTIQVASSSGYFDGFANVAAAPNGEFVVSWFREENGRFLGIFARRFASNGTPIGDDFQVSDPTVAADVIVKNSAGVTTFLLHEGSGSRNFVIRQLTSNGDLLPRQSLGISQYDRYSLAINDSGKMVLVWDDLNRIRAVMLDETGLPVGDVFDVSTGRISYDCVAFDASGNFAVTWSVKGTGSLPTEIWCRRFNANGEPIGAPFLVHRSTGFAEEYVSIVSVGEDEWVIAWIQGSPLPSTTRLVHLLGDQPIGVAYEYEEAVVTQLALTPIAGGKFAMPYVRQLDSSKQGLFLSVFTVNEAPVVELILPDLGLRTDGGAGHAVRGQVVEIELAATDAWSSDPDADYTFRIDWDNDGSFDEEILGPSGIMASHVFTAAGSYVIGLQVVDIDGGVSETVTRTVIVTDWDKRQDAENPAVVDLYVGGTNNDDAFAFLPGMFQTLIENGTFFVVPKVNLVGSYNGVIRVFAQGGNDLVLGDVLTSSLLIDGGNGDDVLVGGRGSDTIWGGSGNDMIFGGTLETDLGDWIDGEEGTDLLVGSLGGDTLTGGEGKDLLVGGRLSFTNISLAAYSILSEWTSPRDFETRIANLSGTGSGPRFNGDFFLVPGETVLEDNAVDTIHGGLLDSDWALFGDGDIVTGQPGPLVQVGEEERVDFGGTPIGWDAPPAIALRPDGSAQVLWLAGTDDLDDHLNFFRQTINADGQIESYQRYSFAVSDILSADADVDPMGNVTIVWAGYNGNIYVNRFDASGEQIGATLSISQPGSNRATLTIPQIDVDSNGDAVIGWNQKNGVFVRYLSADGTLGNAIQVPGAPGSSVGAVISLAINDAGTATVLYGVSEGNEQFGLRAQLMNSLGAVGSQITVGSGIFNLDFAGIETTLLPYGLAMNALGQFVVSWPSYNAASGSDNDVVARSFDSDGTALSDAFVVSASTDGYQYAPAVSMNDAGQFVVSWSTSSYGGATPATLARRFLQDGTAVTGDVVLSQGSSANHQITGVGLADSGSLLVTAGPNRASTAPRHVYASWVDATGVVTSPASQLDQTPAPIDSFLYSYPELFLPPQSATNAHGDQVVVWFNGGIYAQATSATGLKPPRIDVMTGDGTSTFNLNGDVAMATNGDFVVVWHNTTNNVERHLVQRYALDGTPIGELLELPKTFSTLSDFATVGMDGAGNAVIVRVESEVSTHHVRLFRISPAGDLIGSPIEVASGSNFKHFSSAVNAAGEVAISWIDQVGSNFRLWAAKVDEANQIVCPPILVSENLYSLIKPGGTDIALADDGSFVLTWESNGFSDGLPGIRVQRFSSDGTALGSPFRATSSPFGGSDPAITFVASGAFVVSWREGGDLYLQQFAGQVRVGEPERIAVPVVYSMTSGSTGDLLVTAVRISGAPAYASLFVTRFSAVESTPPEAPVGLASAGWNALVGADELALVLTEL